MKPITWRPLLVAAGAGVGAGAVPKISTAKYAPGIYKALLIAAGLFAPGIDDNTRYALMVSGTYGLGEQLVPAFDAHSVTEVFAETVRAEIPGVHHHAQCSGCAAAAAARGQHQPIGQLDPNGIASGGPAYDPVLGVSPRISDSYGYVEEYPYDGAYGEDPTQASGGWMAPLRTYTAQ